MICKRLQPTLYIFCVYCQVLSAPVPKEAAKPKCHTASPQRSLTRKLILHIGHAKTGTTTLQKTLVASRSVLSARGILHPDTAPHKHNHRSLIPYLVAAEGDAPTVDSHAASDLWHKVVAQIDRDNPHTIVLSSEQLFRAWTPSQLSALIEKLRGVTQEISVAVYVREPAALVLSLVQQGLKSRALSDKGIQMPNPRPALEAFQSAAFDVFKVKAFDRQALAGGSVVQDFFETFLPEVDLSDLILPEDDNTSMSAEAMAVLQDIRSGARRFHFGKPQREVRRADQQLDGFSRPQLLPEMRDAIRAGYPHYRWLKDTHGVVFSGLDVKEVDPAVAQQTLDGAKRIEDICKVDAARKAELWRKLSRPDAMIRRLLRPA